LTSTAAASSTAIATVLSARRLAPTPWTRSPRAPRPHDQVVHPTPRQRQEDEPGLDEQRPAVRRRPEVVDRRQPLDRDDGAGEDENADEPDGDP
jgi:hypothetical protein